MGKKNKKQQVAKEAESMTGKPPYPEKLFVRVSPESIVELMEEELDDESDIMFDAGTDAGKLLMDNEVIVMGVYQLIGFVTAKDETTTRVTVIEHPCPDCGATPLE